MEPNETLEPTASEQEQPVEEAVAPETQEQPVPEPVAEEASTEPEQPSFTSRTWAGKYKDPEELERAYLEAQREASRMAGELSALKKSPGTTQTTEPEHKKLEVERNRWAQYLRNPNLSEQERLQADEQVRLYDRAIAKAEALYEFRQESTRQSATQTLEQESQQVLQQYQSDLSNMASPLYQAAATRYQSLVNAGYPDNNATKALAVAYAAALTGQGMKQAVQQDRGKLLKTLNQQAKKAVVAGAGGPAAVKSGQITAKDIDNMSDAEFAAYERKLLGV
jgi:hypothetical protein